MPKSLYRSLEFSEAEESWSSEIYQTTHVSKGSPHEVSQLLRAFGGMTVVSESMNFNVSYFESKHCYLMFIFSLFILAVIVIVIVRFQHSAK